MALHYSPNIVTNGLVLALDASDPKSYPGSGTTWFDRSGNGNNGTLVNGVGYDSANRGSLVFDGVNDYVNITETANMTPQILTIDLVFSCVSSTNTATGGNNGAAQVLLFRQNTRTAQFEGYSISYNEATGTITVVTTQTSGVQRVVSSLTGVALNQTSMITAVIDNTTISIYINGVFSNSGVKDAGINYGTNHTLKIGRALAIGNSFDSLFNGRVHLTRIYNRALSASEISQNFNVTRGRFGL